MHHALALLTCAALSLHTFDDLPQEAMGQSPVVDGRAAVDVALLSTVDSFAPGSEARLGIHFALSPNWHIYGANPGSAGFPTSVQWQVVRGTVGPLHYPTPMVFQESDDVFTYGYSHNVLLSAALRADGDNDGPVVVEALVKYLACNIICSPGEVRLRRTLPITPQGAQTASLSVLAAFAEADAPGAPKPSAQGEAPVGIWQAVLLAWIGGLVLNLMPCVLPVLALKAMSLLQTGRSKTERRRHGLGYGAGVVGSTLALGVVVMVVRAAGHSVGWGFQFQQPLFIAAVALGLLLFACSCFGLFELTHGVGPIAQAHDRAQGMRRSVLEGVLAVLVATPCSAPFLGTAVAFALAQSDAVVALVFVAIGVGLASPFVVLSWVPALGRMMPRPGPWMGHLKTLLGFCLLATCVWLVWLFARARGVDDGALLLALMVAAACGAWLVGLISHGAPGRLTPLLLALVLLLGYGAHALLPQPQQGPQSATLVAPYSQALVDHELRAGHNVLVDFTADWCITCKFNERHVLRSEEVQQAMSAHHITLLKADFTRHDDAILAVLKSHGRAGVPMYLLYTPTTADKPLLLPEILTIDTLTAAFTGL